MCQDYVHELCQKKCLFEKVYNNDVWNAEIPSAAERSVYGTNSKYRLELSGPHQIEFKKNLSNLVKFQTTNTCTCVAAKNGRTVKQSHCETVYGLVKLAQYLCDVTGSPTVNGGRVCHFCLFSVLIPLVCHVHLRQYSSFGRIFSAIANRYRKSASLLKRSVSIISIS